MSANETGKGLTIEERERAREMAALLGSGFLWGRTPQGPHYWADVYESLLRIAYHDEEAEAGE